MRPRSAIAAILQAAKTSVALRSQRPSSEARIVGTMTPVSAGGRDPFIFGLNSTERKKRPAQELLP
jgi:hypothetical protein